MTYTYNKKHKIGNTNNIYYAKKENKELHMSV
jgi:hypothetical protein